jgi:hypothetical protein
MTLVLLGLSASSGLAAVGDPQTRTDHPFYPGELSCSTFERLFATQAALYQRITNRSVDSDEDKALASWYWRNINYWHGEEGKCDLFDTGFSKTDWNREYWAGLVAHGHSLCGTTHAQWNAEFNALLGHCRSRSVGVSGHNSFEVYLTGGAYGTGKWALLDHDISTVIFAPDGSRLLGINEIVPQIKTLKNPNYKPERQRGWRVSGLHDDDAGGVYTSFKSAEYLAGYAGPPPRIHLRKGETLRRYLKPGLDDGKTFVYWGMNYKEGGIPGPARSRTWVNQPEKMYGAKRDTGHKDGQARYGNAVYTYTPDFTSDAFKEGVVAANDVQVTFEFNSPYIIAATPANDSKWGIYERGATNGLVVSGKGATAQISTDLGKTWSEATPLPADLTDFAKGHHQYWLRINAQAPLRDSGLSIRTVCQLNPQLIPHLRDGVNKIAYESSNLAHVSAGPNKDQAEAHVVDGKIGSSTVTVELHTPRGEKATRLYAASWQASGNPPAATKYQIEYSLDGGRSWKPIVKDWQIVRRPEEPKDFWSQSFAWGDVELPKTTAPVRVRFKNDGGKSYRKVEAHLAYEVENPSPCTITYGWKNTKGEQTATHIYDKPRDDSWSIDAGQNVQTLWVEYAAK